MSIEAEYGCRVGGLVRGGEVYVYFSGCTLGSERFELSELEELGVRVVYVEGLGGKRPEEILEGAVDYLVDVLGELKPLTYVTLSTGIEYALYVFRDGAVYVAEGGLGRVVLPYVGGVLVEAHTHPASCLPSGRDVDTALARYMEGLYSSSVVSPTCTLITYRVAPIAEEELEELKRKLGSLDPAQGAGAITRSVRVRFLA